MANVSLLGALGGLESSGLSFRNKLINGGFDIWQRNTSFSSPASGTYTADRWVVTFNGSAATRIISRQDFPINQTDVPGNPRYFLKFNQTVAGSGGTSNVLSQRLEGVRTLSGQVVTVSFWAKAAANTTVSSRLTQSFGTSVSTGGTPVPTASVVSSLGTNTITQVWQRFQLTYTVPTLPASAVFGSDNNDFLAVEFVFPNNATFNVDIANVQIEAGSAPTPFEVRPIGMELSLCQRYCQKLGPGQLFRYFGVVPGTGSTTTYARINLKQSMRTVPSALSTTGLFQVSTDGTAINVTISGIDAAASEDVAVLNLNAASATTAGFCYMLLAASDATASITLAAEL